MKTEYLSLLKNNNKPYAGNSHPLETKEAIHIADDLRNGQSGRSATGNLLWSHCILTQIHFNMDFQ